MVLTPEEMTGLWHLPDESFTASSIVVNENKSVKMSSAIAEVTEGIQLGVNRANGQESQFSLPPKVVRSYRHHRQNWCR